MNADVKKLNGRDRLIASSLKLFSKKGYHGCSIREICDAAKANISLVSFHFGGKEGLLDALFSEMVSENFNQMDKFLVAPQSKEEFEIRLDLFLNSYVDFYLQHPDVVSLFLEELERGHQQAMGILPETYGKIWKSLVRFLKITQENKIINDRLDSKILAYQIISPLTHLMRSRNSSYINSLFTLDDEKFRKQILRQIVETIPY